jgi:hypothetical protein
MRKFLRSRRGRYALAFVVVGTSLGIMGAQCQPTKEAPPTSLSINPTSKDFGDQVTTEGPTAATTFTVTNDGPDTSGPLAVVLEGGNPADFNVPVGGDDCVGNQLDSGETCDIDVTFDPTTSGPLSTNLVVSGSPGGSATAALSGYGATSS